MNARGDLITVNIPPLDPRTGAAVLSKIVAGVGQLWNAGRFRSLLDSEEGRAAVATFEAARLDAQSQMAAATAHGLESAPVRLRVPRESARGAVVFVRTVLSMLSDPGTVSGLGVEALGPADVDFAERQLQAFEAGVAAQQPRRSPPV